MSLAALVSADALGSSGLSVVSLALAISAAVLFSLRGLGPLTVAFGFAALVAVTSQASGTDFLVAGRVRMENDGVTVELLERGAIEGREQGVDQTLQTAMLRDALDYNGDPGIAVLLTGDGSGFIDGVGFHADLERMHRRGWRIEVLSWRHSCNRRMREWAEQNGTFVALDDFYENITFLGPAMPGDPIAEPRHVLPIDLGRRP